MKRILYSCLFFLTFCISKNLNAQGMQFTVEPNGGTFPFNSIQCYNTAGNTATAALTSSAAGATSYTWLVTGPSTCTTPTTYTLAVANGTALNMTLPCCGVYTVNAIALFQSTPIDQTAKTITVVCPTGGNIVSTNTALCYGSTATLSFPGLSSQIWIAQPTAGGPTVNVGTANPQTVTPLVNTSYTMSGLTAQGCPVVATTSIVVQKANFTVSPVSQTMCLGSTVCFNATASAAGGSSVTPGTQTTSVTWFLPSNPPPVGPSFATGLTTCTAATAGNYAAMLVHTGVAGSCSITLTSAVVIGTNIPVSITASSLNVCPGNNVTLTAVPSPTTGTTYTWSNGANTKSIVVTVNSPTCYVVDVDYTGCPGSQTVCLGILSLTPGLSLLNNPVNSVCPNTSLTLLATGGSSYTYSYYNPASNTSTVIGAPTTTNNQMVHTPSIAPYPFLPATYIVQAFQGGCTGFDTLVVQQRSLFPTLVASSPSVCPNSTFTIATLGVGGSATYTYSASFLTPSTVFSVTTSDSVVHSAPTPFPHTYIVDVDSAGCTGSAQVQIELLTLRTDLTASSASICPETQFTLTSTGGAGTSYTFTAPYPTATVNVIQQSTNNVAYHTPSGTNTPSFPFQYTVRADSAGCMGIDSVIVGKLNLTPNLLLTPSSASVCPNNTFTLNANGGAGMTYTFTQGTTTLGTAGTTVKTVTSSSSSFPISYSVAADSAGCRGSATSTVYLHVLQPILTANPDSVCSGMTTTLNATGGSNTYFTFVKGIATAPFLAVIQASSTVNNATDSPTTQTTYSVFADSSGCQGIGTTTVYIRAPLTLTASASSQTVCSGLTATLSVAGPTAATYTWFDPNGSIGSSVYPATVAVSPTVTTSYTVAGLDSLGCIGNAVITVSVNPTASLAITLAPQGTTICPGQTATLTASGAVSYTWSPSASLNNAFSSSVISNTTATTIFTVKGTNGQGCFGASTITLDVGTYPSPTITATAWTICPGFTSTLTAYGANSYTWTGDSLSGPVAQQSIAVGPGTYSVLLSNGGGCTVSTYTTVTLGQPLNIQASASSPTTCIANNAPKYSKPVILSATGASNYYWYPYNPMVMTYSLGFSTTVRPPTSTCFTVIGVTSVCSGTSQICINVIPQFTMNVVPPLPAMCLGDSLKLSIINIQPYNSNAGTGAVGPASAFSYSWTEAANAPPISMSSMFTQTVMVFPQNTTTYSVEVLDSRKCVSLPRLVTVTVLPKPMTTVSIPTINSVPTNTVCYVGLNPGPPDVVLTLTGINKNTNLPFGVVPTYTWLSPYNAPYVSILTPANNNAVTVSAPLRAPSVVVYTVISGYNGIPGCKVADTVSVRVIDCRPITNVAFTTAEPIDTICTRQCITYMTLTDTMAGGPQTYSWTFPGGAPATSTLANPIVCYNLPGQQSVILKVRSPYPVGSNGSEKTVGQLNYINVVDIPNITIISPGNYHSDTTIRFGQSIDLHGSGGKTYYWEPNYNISSLTNPDVTIKPFRSIQYILTGYNSKNCASSDTLNVIVVEDCGEMYVPNAFSPNGDGHNDVLKVNGICLETLTLMIFNRWGEKVFESTNQSVGWDGTYKGDEMNTGVYVFRLEGKTFDGKAFSAKGNITLIR